MTQFMVSMVGRVAVVGHAAEPVNEGELIEGHLDEVMDELLQLKATDPVIDLNLARNEVTMSLLIEATDPLTATNAASGLIRTAIHAAGGSTPDWPVPPDPRWSVVLTSLRSDLAEIAATVSLAELIDA